MLLVELLAVLGGSGHDGDFVQDGSLLGRDFSFLVKRRRVAMVYRIEIRLWDNEEERQQVNADAGTRKGLISGHSSPNIYELQANTET